MEHYASLYLHVFRCYYGVHDWHVTTAMHAIAIEDVANDLYCLRCSPYLDVCVCDNVLYGVSLFFCSKQIQAKYIHN